MKANAARNGEQRITAASRPRERYQLEFSLGLQLPERQEVVSGTERFLTIVVLDSDTPPSDAILADPSCCVLGLRGVQPG